MTAKLLPVRTARPLRPHVTDGTASKDGQLGKEAPKFLRKRSAVCWLLAFPFLGACAGVCALIGLYHWPDVNALIYYFTVRPAFVWFGMLLPFLLIGAFGLRPRWIVLGCALWLAGLFATEEIVQCLKVRPSPVRKEFWLDRMAFNSYIESATPRSGFVQVPLRVVSWNVHVGILGPEGIARQLAGLDPDIVLFQEISPSVASALESQFDEGDFHLQGSILSRYPVEPLEPTHSLAPIRGSVWRVHISPELALTAINVHLSPQGLRTQLLRGWNREMLVDHVNRTWRELALVSMAVQEFAAHGPVLLAGDFNLPANYAFLRQATSPLKDAFRENGYGWGKTVKPSIPVSRIDMIYVPPDARVYYSAAVNTTYSDHNIVLAEVSVPVPVRKDGGRQAHTPLPEQPPMSVTSGRQ